jgi:hypothetical protein
MTRRLITDAEDWTVTLQDGFMALAFELDPSYRIRITGYEHSYDGTDPVYGSGHSLDAIDDLADRLKAMTAHARGDDK